PRNRVPRVHDDEHDHVPVPASGGCPRGCRCRTRGFHAGQARGSPFLVACARRRTWTTVVGTSTSSPPYFTMRGSVPPSRVSTLWALSTSAGGHQWKGPPGELVQRGHRSCGDHLEAAAAVQLLGPGAHDLEAEP